MQQYQHNTNFNNQHNNYQQDNYYQADQIKDKKTKSNFWGYFLTATISVFLTAGIILGVVLSVGGNLFSTADTLSFVEKSKTNIFSSTDLETGSEDGLSLTFENTPENKAALSKLESIFKLVKDNYYHELSDSDLINAMATGMVDGLESPYTYYMTPEYVEEVEESMSGEYSGIGAIVEKVGTTFQISDIIEDSPAEKIGLMINDVFVAVDDENAEEFEDVTMLAMNIRGEEGTKVKITVFRPSESKEYEFEITRASIKNANIRSRMLTDKIGYVRIVEFNEGVSDNFITAMEELQDQGAKDIVFDLRNNGGGYVNEVLRMLDYLLPEGELITEQGRRDGEAFEISESSGETTGVPEDMKFICIMNKNSASASELFSGCLRDWQKAELVGEKSFGKGVGTITQYLEDGSALQITNFYYNLPSGENVDGEGLEPTYEVELPEDVRNMIISRIDPEQDTQLQKAIEILEK